MESEKDDDDMENNLVEFKRLFTTRALIHSETLFLSISNVNNMRDEFPDYWKELIISAYQRFSIEA